MAEIEAAREQRRAEIERHRSYNRVIAAFIACEEGCLWDFVESTGEDPSEAWMFEMKGVDRMSFSRFWTERWKIAADALHELLQLEPDAAGVLDVNETVPIARGPADFIQGEFGRLFSSEADAEDVAPCVAQVLEVDGANFNSYPRFFSHVRGRLEERSKRLAGQERASQKAIQERVNPVKGEPETLAEAETYMVTRRILAKALCVKDQLWFAKDLPRQMPDPVWKAPKCAPWYRVRDLVEAMERASGKGLGKAPITPWLRKHLKAPLDVPGWSHKATVRPS